MSLPSLTSNNTNRVHLVINLNSSQNPKIEGAKNITFEELVLWTQNRSIIQKFFSFSQVTFYTYRLDTLIRPFLIYLLIRLFSRGSCKIVDDNGCTIDITISEIAKQLFKVIREFPQLLLLKNKVKKELNQIRSREEINFYSPDVNAAPIYLRTDLWFGTKTGGSIAHISGVINNFVIKDSYPVFFTSDFIPLCNPKISQRIIQPQNKFWNYREIPSILYNQTFIDQVTKDLQDLEFPFVYQRYSVNNYAGLALSRKFNKPFVLEFNGSEVWISQNWGKPFVNERLTEDIEGLNLKLADLIVVVSRFIKEGLMKQNIPEEKILVNPNGVDIDRYKPQQLKPAEALPLTGKTVIGFVGTFGAWHGAEVLAAAFIKILSDTPKFQNKIHLLMIGDGIKMPEVKQMITSSGFASHVSYTGLTKQEEGPRYMGLCDILVSPQIPNSDNSPFFGSPTKLFEYMAMEKGIVASNLGQIGEIIEDGVTGILVEPGCTHSLTEGILKLLEDVPLRNKLGVNARRKVCTNYTWEIHAQNIINALKSLSK